jgi:hypothetical protein
MTVVNSTPKDKTNKIAAKVAANREQADTWSAEERAAMQERVKEIKVVGRGKPKTDPEEDVLTKIAEMVGPDQAMARRLHELIKTHVPSLSPKTWYGMPAYAKDGKIVCFFQCSSKFKTRYSTLGFSDAANLDDGAFWPVAYAVKALSATEEERIIALVKKAVS